MSRPGYRLTEAQLAGLGQGYGDQATIELLRSAQASKRRLLLRAVVTAELEPDDAPRGPRQEAWAVLVAAWDAATAPVEEILRHPFVDAWATRFLLSGGEDLAYLIGLAVAAAARAGVEATLHGESATGQLMLPTLGLAHGLGRGPFTAVVTAEGLTLRGIETTVCVPAPFGDDGPGWCARRTLTAGSAAGPMTLTIEDLDPYRTAFSLPIADRLAGPDRGRLSDLFSQAWLALGRDHPEHAQAMRIGLQSLVPLVTPPDGTISSSSRLAFGSIAVCLPADPAELALLMLHEAQHMKLGALLDVVDLHLPDGQPRHFAPWRMDPRPVGALLQGAYAHTAVTDYWRGRRQDTAGRDQRTAEFEFAYWLGQTAAATETLLASGELTDSGRRFVEDLRGTLAQWQQEPTDDDIAAGVGEIITAAFVRWRLLNIEPDDEGIAALTRAWQANEPCPPLPAARIKEASPRAARCPAGLASDIRSSLLDHDPSRTGTRGVSGRGELDAVRFADRAARNPQAVDAWEDLAIALGSTDLPAGLVVSSRPEIIRALVVACGVEPPEALKHIDALSSWMAAL